MLNIILKHVINIIFQETCTIFSSCTAYILKYALFWKYGLPVLKHALCWKYGIA